MSKLDQVCIGCGRPIEQKASKEEGFSGGACEGCMIVCLVPLYRRRQQREGFFPCFCKAEGFCDRFDCLYRSKCLSPTRPPAEIIENIMEWFSASIGEIMSAGHRPFEGLF